MTKINPCLGLYPYHQAERNPLMEQPRPDQLHQPKVKQIQMATFFPVRQCRHSTPNAMPRNCISNSVFLQIISLQWQPLSRSCSPVPNRDQNNALRVNCSTLKHIVLYWPCQNSAFILALSAEAQSPALCCINNALHLTNVAFIDLREEYCTRHNLW